MVRSGGGAAAPAAELAIPVGDPLPSSGDHSFPSSLRSGGAAVKRYTHADSPSPSAGAGTTASTPPRRGGRSRLYGGPRWGPRRGGSGWAPSRAELCFYCGALTVTALLAASFLLPQGLVPQVRPWEEGERAKGRPGGGVGVVRFVPADLLRRFEERRGIDRIRLERSGSPGVRPPRLAVVVGAMKKDPSSLMLSTLIKGLGELGYLLSVFSVDGGNAHLVWEKIGLHTSILTTENCTRVNWSAFDGIILGSLEAKPVVSSLLQDPFSAIPLIWIIQEDTLANRLPVYLDSGGEQLISDWKSSFSRADVVVFPEFSLAMLHSSLDTGNFYVITGSPVDAWSAKVYSRFHSKLQLRKDSGFGSDDLVIAVIGSSVLYDELPWEYAATIHVLKPLLTQFAREKGIERSFKFLFLCGNSSVSHDKVFQEIASHLGFPDNSIRHYSFDMDVNGPLLMADIALYASFQNEQGFPSLLQRAMSFGVPIIAPDLPIIKKNVVDNVNGLIYRSHDVETLMRAFSLLLSEMELSELAHAVASSGKSLSENMFAFECIRDYAKLLENVVHFPSDTILPRHVSEIQQHTWDWSFYELDESNTEEQFQTSNLNSDLLRSSSIVFSMEENFSESNLGDMTGNGTEAFADEYPNALDWEEVEDIEASEEFRRLELEQIEERMEKTSGSWEYLYNTARKSEKKKFEVNERDDGELERIGRPLCIYEIYNGPGTWPFLHHGAIYRGISLSKGVRRSRSDDIDAVDRLPLLNDRYYKDLLCEMGGMLSVANKVDTIHKIPWIGFQSWRAVGRKFSLSVEAEKVLEEAVVDHSRGDAIYFWAKLGMDERQHGKPDFWTMCDTVNNGKCRIIFEDAFRHMYGLPNEKASLPPMPQDDDEWSTLHSWVMPTPSFLELMMFSRMFVDSLHNITLSSSEKDTCLLGSSELEKKNCYCRILDLAVNVWAYHSARKMFYINPDNGELREQHPIEKRRGMMWVKYFNFSLLKSMDEDLAEEADDGLRPLDGWLWPLTGEVHWQGILDREREERYRKKMDKQRKNLEKLLERQRYGYKQKALGG